MPKYKKGKFPYTVKDTVTGKLYVRKSFPVFGKQKQIWRLCEPQTAVRFLEVLAAIEQEIESRNTGK